jgi:hypothetical protein
MLRSRMRAVDLPSGLGLLAMLVQSAAHMMGHMNTRCCCVLLQVQKSKAGTGRVVGFRELGLANAYTIEASFCGASVGKYAKQHFNTGGLGAKCILL